MSIEVNLPEFELTALPPGTSLAAVHHSCAIRARTCWSLWNDGYPIARILDHYPKEVGYTIILAHDQNYHSLSEDILYDDKPRERPYIEPSVLATFLIDLLRLEKAGILGRFVISFTHIHYGFERNQFGGEGFVLVPDLGDILEGSIERTDVLSLAKIAADYCLPDRVSDCESIEAIISRIAGLVFRKDSETQGEGKLIVNLNEERHSMWIEHNRERFRINANPHGFWMPSRNQTPTHKGSKFQFRFVRIRIAILWYLGSNGRFVGKGNENLECWSI